MSPLPPKENDGKIQDGDQAGAESAPSLPKMAKLQPVPAATMDQAPAASDHGKPFYLTKIPFGYVSIPIS